jgi:hypothetical protein
MKSPLNRGGLRFFLVLTALSVGTFLCGATTARSILAGLPLLCVGICIHIWAKGCLRQNQLVATIGPYRFVRHPFYLANALIDSGLVVMSGWWPLAILFPSWWLAIYIQVIRGEERFLCEKFPQVYPAYQQRVPCLLPWRRPLPYSGEGFRWSNPNIAGGEELPRAVRILAYPLLFFVAKGLRDGGVDWFRDGWNLTGFCGLLALYASAWQLNRHQRTRRAILPQAFEHPVWRAAIGALVLVAVWWIVGPATSLRNVVSIGGAVVLLLSVPCYARRPVRAILAEWVALLGTIAAGELLWLAPGVALLYQAWILDRLLAAGPPAETSDDSAAAASASTAAFWPYLYPPLVVACSAVVGVKLVGRLLPYHLF